MASPSDKKELLFWLFLIPCLLIVALALSLLPWFLELSSTPSGQVFSGINRWSGDYFTYLSYVELGRRGEILARLLATTMQQKPVFTHLAHTAAGYFFGHILGLNSVASYHLARSLYGLIFLFFAFVFFYRLSKNKTISVLSFIFTFFIAGFPLINNLSPLNFSRPLSWLQEQNIIGRPTGPLHYNLGFIFFILCFLWLFSEEKNSLKKIIIFGLLFNLLLIANPFAFLIFTSSFCLYFLIRIISSLKKLLSLKNDFIIAVGSYLIALPLFIYNQIFLSQEPWGRLGVAPKYYIVTHPPIPFFEALLSIGPIFFLGLIGMVLARSKLSNYFIFLISWLAVQFSLFFFGDYIKLDPLRSFNGLYYLPLALFSAYTIVFFSNQIHKIIRLNKEYIIALIMAVIFFISLPNYWLSFKDQLYAFTDFKSYSTFSYPTVKQVESFKWLEKNTLVGSGVLALYEASFLMIGFSGNSTGANMEHNQKLPFYTASLTNNDAFNFLKNNHFQYVYYGYQEKSVGGNIEKYPFLKKIYRNEEVEIYQVI